MAVLQIRVVYGNGETENDSKYQVANLVEARRALVADLWRTADPTWAMHVLEDWDRHPGRADMRDGNVTWTFHYID